MSVLEELVIEFVNLIGVDEASIQNYLDANREQIHEFLTLMDVMDCHTNFEDLTKYLIEDVTEENVDDYTTWYEFVFCQ